MDLNETLGRINPWVAGLKEYHLEPETCVVKLNQNETPFDWPDEIKDALADFCRTRPWNRYPDFIPVSLKERLAQHVSTEISGMTLTGDNIIVGNGSNEMLLVLLLSLMDRVTPVVLCQPTFTVYNMLVNGIRGRAYNVALNSDLSFDVPSILSAIAKNPGCVLILCSPNNPTGTTLSQEQIRDILRVHTGFFILDQAYVEFGGFNAVGLISEYPNLIVTRTFSKAFAGAGFRVGYMVGSSDVIRQINKVKLPYNINFVSDKAAQLLLEHTSLVADRVAQIKAGRETIVAALSALPFEMVYPSTANFVLVRCTDSKSIFEHLRSKSILVRDVSSYPMLSNCLRISVGTAHENELLIAALQEYFNR